MNTINAQKQLTDRELIIFNAELDRKQKSATTAYLLYFFLGIFGVHKFYVGKPILGFSYIFLLFGGVLLTFIGLAHTPDSVVTEELSTVSSSIGPAVLALLGVGMAIDLFTIPGQIRTQEDLVRKALLEQLDRN
jgi:TM2 domain-containing membrane protein YozV